jgi:hypothetical protein
MTVSRTVKTAILMILILFEVGFESVYQVAVGAETPGLFISLSGSATALDKQTAADLTVFRSRLVRVDWGWMHSVDGTAQGQASSTGRVVLNLFDDAVFVAVLNRREVRSDRSFTWLGHIEGAQRSQVTLVVEDDVVVGNIRVADLYFQVRYRDAGVHVIRQVDESRFPPDGEPIPVNIPTRETTRDFGIAAADDGSTFDVMVVYTPAARAAAGGTTAMNALINLAVSETNTAYSRSGVIPRVRLVHAEEVAYTESRTFSTDLNRLRNPSDGFMDNVHALRNAHGADLVSLFIEGTSLCGIAYLMLNQSNAFEAFAFSVVARICATGNYTFGHELGHNMGLQHDRADAPGNGVFLFSHGYVDIPHNFRDIMGTQTSCITCVRIQNFSNPNVTFNGFPTGVSQALPQSADAAASLNATAFTVAMLAGDPMTRGRSLRSNALLACLLGGGGLALAAVAGSIWLVLLGFGVMFGFSNGLVYGVSLQVAQRTTETRRGLLTGIAVSSYMLGTAAGTPLLSASLTLWNYRVTLLILAAYVAASGFLAYLLLRWVVGGEVTLLPPSGPLPAGATTYQDTAQPDGALVCYFVLPLAGSN